MLRYAFAFLLFAVSLASGLPADVQAQIAAPATTLPSPPTGEWDRSFQLHGLNGNVNDMAFVGDRLYVAGTLGNVAAIAEADNIAYWDGTAWNALGDGLNATVRKLVVRGSDLYVAGSFINAGGIADADYLARWDGRQWHAVAPGLTGLVKTMAFYNGELYVGGTFKQAGGDAETEGFARWDGQQWQPAGTAEYVTDMGVFDGELYATGFFKQENGDPQRLARWDGAQWQGIAGLGAYVRTLAVGDDGVYVGGSFMEAGGVKGADKIARWDGAQWHAVGGGLATCPVCSYVQDLDVYDGSVYATGKFASAGGVPGTQYIARWDGAQWHSIGGGADNRVYQLAVGPAGVYLNKSGDLVTLKGDGWTSMFSDEGNGFKGTIRAVASAGEGVYVGSSTGVNASEITMWDGAQWQSVSEGLNGRVEALLTRGADLYAGGHLLLEGEEASGVARWDGHRWHPLEEGLTASTGGRLEVRGLAEMKGDLYAVGSLAVANGPGEGLARWDGRRWHAVGDGIGDYVVGIAANDENLYVIGYFDHVGNGVEAQNIAKWSGTEWSPLGQGIEGFMSTVATGNGGMFVGGRFSRVDVTDTESAIAFWDGVTWTTIGDEVWHTVHALKYVNGYLYVGGSSKNGEVKNVARWDGTTWQNVGGGTNGTVLALDVAEGRAVVGGSFTEVGDGVTSHQFGIYKDPLLLGGGDEDGGVRVQLAGANPAWQRTEVLVVVDEAQLVTSEVVDVLGRRVATIHEGVMEPGVPYRLAWTPAGVAPGVYFIHITGAQGQATQKIVLAR